MKIVASFGTKYTNQPFHILQNKDGEPNILFLLGDRLFGGQKWDVSDCILAIILYISWLCD